MKISAQALREMGISIPSEIPDCAMTDMPDVSVDSTTYNDTSRAINVDLRLDFSGPFDWIVLSAATPNLKSISRNKREGWFVGKGAEGRRMRQGQNFGRMLTPIRKRKARENRLARSLEKDQDEIL